MKKLMIILFFSVLSINTYSMSSEDQDACIEDLTNESMQKELKLMRESTDEYTKYYNPFTLMTLIKKVDRQSSSEMVTICDQIETIIREARKDVDKAVEAAIKA